MRAWALLALVLCGFGWSAPAAIAEPTRGAVYSNLDRICQIYTEQVLVNGQILTAYGHACPQPDGTLRIMHDAVVLPQSQIPGVGRCVERIENCDRSCDDHGFLGARHYHADCTRSCDLICGNR